MLWAHCSAHHHCAVMVIHLFHLFFDDRFHQHLGPDDVIPSKAWGTVYFKNGLDSKRTSTEVGYEHRNHERQTDRQTLKRRKAEQKQRHHPRVTCIHGNRFVFLLTHTRTSTHTHLRTCARTHIHTLTHTYTHSLCLLPFSPSSLSRLLQRGARGPLRQAAYLRLSHRDDAADAVGFVQRVLAERNNGAFEAPSLILSIVGSSRELALSNRLLEAISDGLHEIVRHSNAWVVTSGNHSGMTLL